MIVLFLFIIGICVGSFLNVVIDRIPQGTSIIVGRSFCDNCHKTLAWYDLIPLFSFFFLRGKCRYCHTTLSWQYPCIEAVTGILFAGVYMLDTTLLLKTDIPTLAIHILLSAIFLALFVMDIRYGILSDVVIIWGIVLSLLLLFFSPGGILVALISGISSFLFFLAIIVVTRGRGMGLGDAKFGFFMGLLLGFPKVIVGLYVAFLTGACVALILVLGKRKKFFGGTIAFGPFLIIGTIVALWWGDTIWMWLLRLMGI